MHLHKVITTKRERKEDSFPIFRTRSHIVNHFFHQRKRALQLSFYLSKIVKNLKKSLTRYAPMIIYNQIKKVGMDMEKENKYEPQARYDKANTTRVYIKLNKNTDADIIEFLEKCGNKQGKIKELIRREIAKRKES